MPFDSWESVRRNLLKGVEKAVLLQESLEWHFNELRPEYLLTVQVADAMADLHRREENTDSWKIYLECTTGKAINEIVAGGNLWVRSFGKAKQARKKLADDKRFRKGRIDILAAKDAEGQTDNGCCYVVELKGLNPTSTAIRADVERIGILMGLADADNRLERAFVVFAWKATGRFTSLDKRKKDLEKSLGKTCAAYGLSMHTREHLIRTNTGPEEGTPEVYGICLAFERRPISLGSAR